MDIKIVQEPVHQLLRMLRHVTLWGIFYLLSINLLAHANSSNHLPGNLLRSPSIVLGIGITLDKHLGQYDEPLSLHKYLYCHGDPVNGVDPSGHEFTILGLNISMDIQKSLNTIKNSRIVRFWTRGLRNKTTDINLVTTRTVPGLPSHWYIYVDRRGSGIDLAYHVGVENVRGFIRGGLSKYLNVFPGEFSIVPTTYAEVRLDAFKVIKVASLNDKQFVAWNAIVIPLGMVGDTAEVPYSVPGYPLTLNCYKWTAEAAAAAFFLQFFPF